MAKSDASCVLPHINVGVDADTINEENAGIPLVHARIPNLVLA